MNKDMYKKHIVYSVMVSVITVNGIIEIIRPDSVPNDTLNNHTILYGVSGSYNGSTSVFGVSWPSVEPISTPKLDNYGNS